MKFLSSKGLWPEPKDSAQRVCCKRVQTPTRPFLQQFQNHNMIDNE